MVMKEQLKGMLDVTVRGGSGSINPRNIKEYFMNVFWGPIMLETDLLVLFDMTSFTGQCDLIASTHLFMATLLFDFRCQIQGLI